MKAITIKYFTALLVMLMITTTSCDFLELESPNDLDASTFFNDAGDAESALIGLYNTMQLPSYYGGNYLLVGEPLCGNSKTGGFDNINIDEFGFQAVTPSNIIVEEMWYGIYNTIANANRLIEGLESISDDKFEDGREAEIEGQARAIRALAHFDLLRFFGEHWDDASEFGIPIVNKVQEIGDIVPRASVEESYTFIISELEASLDLVPQDDRDPAFVNAATVNALLARVHLYKKNYAEASDYATTVIDDTYSLMDETSYASIFNTRQTSEAIFELAFDSQNRSRYNGLTYARPDAVNTEINFLASEQLGEFFATRSGDVRAALVDVNPDNNDTSIQPHGRSQKYRGEVTEDNPAYILRLSEMYLIRAEANQDVDDINAIRNQRGLADANPANASEFQQVLLDEIRAEFNFEGHYFFDLARLDLVESELGIDAFRAILPIPFRELTATKGQVEQNPGYTEF
jgi:hypothetical protein